MTTGTRLAERLWTARISGGVIDSAEVMLPTTIDEAYAVQEEIASLSQQEIRGFKIGSTSLEAQKILGTTEPGSAPLLARYVHESGAEVGISPVHMPSVEGEFAFKMATTLAPREQPYSREEISDAVAAVAGAIEVVGTRFAGGLAGKGRLLTTTDGGVNIGLVVGRWYSEWRSLDLPGHAVRMTINDRVTGEGTGARALGDPMNVLVWLANQQSRRGRGLRAGEIVSTGTCTGLDAVQIGDHVVADYGALGRVEIDFVALNR